MPDGEELGPTEVYNRTDKLDMHPSIDTVLKYLGRMAQAGLVKKPRRGRYRKA